MRDYDETFKEMKKENFNLKLRIFFLEVSFASGQKLLGVGVGRLIVNLTFSTALSQAQAGCFSLVPP